MGTAGGFVAISNAVIGNSIHDNGGLGIDHFPDGVTPNDPGDADTGANNLQNFPLLASAASDGASTTVAGTLSSAPSQSYRLEFFGNPACDASGNGEGKTFLGSADVMTDVNGDGAFTATLPVAASSGDWVAGTATDPANNTSEFSACVQAAAAVARYNWHYEYDPLYRLTYACSDWDDVAATCKPGAEFFRYTYDAVGNRLTQEALAGANTYTYDATNRLTGVDGVTYTWDAKGNLLSDGTSTYAYNHANRLTGVTQGANTYTFAYNGLGDRLRQTINATPIDYTLDLEAGLTQVLSDVTNAYVYGVGRIGEEQPGAWQYHLGDAQGSVRQLADSAGTVTSARAFEPFGGPLAMAGQASTRYGFTGEVMDGTGLIHLRARYLSPRQGRFFQADSWPGDTLRPQTLNGFAYVSNNPATWVDPSGRCYGDFDFLRSYERQNCQNLDMALIILASSSATEAQKRFAGSYVGAWTVGHGYLGVGVLAMTVANPLPGFAGALLGPGYVAVQRALAASGRCGCEAQQWARAADDQKLMRQALIQGFAGGTLFGVGGLASPVSTLGALGQTAVGATGFGLSVAGISSSAAAIASVGWNPCNTLNLGGSAAGLLGSAYILGRGLGHLQGALSVGPAQGYLGASRVATNTDEAFFSSGRSRGLGGERLARQIAESRGGTTLEKLLQERGIELPDFNPNDPASVEAWTLITREYAGTASGVVRAVVGEELRAGSFWEIVELPELLRNPRVSRIIVIDPATLEETVIFERP